MGEEDFQVFALVVMVSTNFAISGKLYILRVKHAIKIQMSVNSVTRHPHSGDVHLADVETRIPQQIKRTVRVTKIPVNCSFQLFYIAPEVRLSVSYLLLSFCFFASTLAFNFLLGFAN